MSIHAAVFINIVLAVVTLYCYVRASRRFYKDKRPFLALLGVAVALDIATALLASFKLTPTTTIPGASFVPWTSILFLLHISSATLGMFGFIAVYLILLVKGVDRPYPFLRKFQLRVLLPAWILGETIALANSILKMVLGIRLYDHFTF
jgi:hypothetical protein